MTSVDDFHLPRNAVESGCQFFPFVFHAAILAQGISARLRRMAVLG
jgi:hypothetical protein